MTPSGHVLNTAMNSATPFPARQPGDLELQLVETEFRASPTSDFGACRIDTLALKPKGWSCRRYCGRTAHCARSAESIKSRTLNPDFIEAWRLQPTRSQLMAVALAANRPTSRSCLRAEIRRLQELVDQRREKVSPRRPYPAAPRPALLPPRPGASAHIARPDRPWSAQQLGL